MILILSEQHDVHADIVVDEINKNGSELFRFNLDVASLLRPSITYQSGSRLVTQNETHFRSSDIKSVWCRKSSMSLTSEQELDRSNGFRLWRSEWNRILFGLYNSLNSIFWLNHIRHATLADNKFHQMSAASLCGLKMPDLISSNNKEHLRNFAEIHDKVALKFMSQDMYRSSSDGILGLYVNKIGVADLDRFGDLVENPITLQKYIDKDYEIRYTVVDNDHFACRIDSQLSKKANIDWRRYDIPSTSHSIIEPEQTIRSSIELLMQNLNLKFGAIDFAVDLQGNWWFLEINSSGQWLWIEDLTGLKIAESVAKYLISHSLDGRVVRIA